MIVRYVENLHNGIQSHNLSRYALGYVIHGTKYIYTGDHCQKATRGDLFYLGTGIQYVENIPAPTRPYEQIVFYYTPEDLQRIVTQLNMTYGMTVSNHHVCEKCRTATHIVTDGWDSLRNFFTSTAISMRTGQTLHDHTAEMIKMTELLYLILAHEDCCLKYRLLSNIDSSEGNFEVEIYDCVFEDLSIRELAERTNRSLTSFKKEFQRHFGMPPHKWFIRQRLNHSRLLLIASSKSISEIGNVCSFPNTSHYIKLFKKEFGITPANYRCNYARRCAEEQSEEMGGKRL